MTANNINKNWGISAGELTWRRFISSLPNKICLTFIGFLVAVAVFAPFLANNKPFVINISGRLYFPLFHALRPVDYIIFLAFVVGLSQVVLIRRGISHLAPSIRGGAIYRQLIVSSAIVTAGTIFIFALVPARHDTTDYRVLIESGRAGNAIFPPVPYGYEQTDLKARHVSPGRQHCLGTDDVGADVLARLIHAARVSLAVGLVAVGISTAIGIMVGAVLGYFGGKLDFIGMRIVEIVMAIPVFFLVIMAVAFFPRTLLNIMLIIGLTGWTGTARLVRSEFLRLRGRDFVRAAVLLGIPLRSILFRHILPNAIAPVLVNATFGISAAIFTEAALSFLGFALTPPTPSWGQMLSQGVTATGDFLWWLTLFPGLAIFLTVLAYNVIGEGLRDAFDPRWSKPL
jgi:peptide/nickel transport system permease protein